MRLPISPAQLKKRLVDEKLIKPEDFDALVTEADRKNQNLLDLLISEKSIDENFLNAVVAENLGVQVANLAAREIDEKILKLIPEDAARQRQAIAFGKEPDGSISMAMTDPADLDSLKYFSQLLKAKIKPYYGTSADLNRGFAVYGLQIAGDFKHIIEENVQASLRNRAKNAAEAAAALPLVAIVDNLLSYAASIKASDIHIEVLEEATLIRYRVDGILHEILRIPKEVHPALVARIKLLSGLKIDEHFKPQDGRFRYQSINEIVDIRVSIMPTYYGEKMVMRLLEATQKPLSLEEVGMLGDVGRVVAENLKKSYGMILTTGPTGSGKSTTLYALVNLINRPEVNIVTIEDPIEYNMRYVNQSQINQQAGITFASGLRSFLRQDPNIIMVGEIRDGETANIAVQAALTGHLLLSTLHTNDAPTTVPRLFDLQVPPFLVASVLNIIIAQRLVRKLCASCVYSYEPDDHIKKSLVAQLMALDPLNTTPKLPTVLFKSKGCGSCGFTGHRGRVGIFEVLEITDTIKKMIISSSFSLDEFKKQARKDGMKSMFEDGLNKVQLGLTSVEEVLRVIQE